MSTFDQEIAIAASTQNEIIFITDAWNGEEINEKQFIKSQPVMKQIDSLNTGNKIPSNNL
ncbi:hypothetical protein [Chitinophaga sp. MM2321]|uniref:hypothetical protein n=1 Tax=Chitinophaga sp. MM2321 TaxID=3137178 RepID=UPI0032D5A3A2